MFNKVVIVGVGELGASIGRDIKNKRLAKKVIGVGRRIASLKKAKKIKAIDELFLVTDLKKAVEDADLIILATPVLKIVELGLISGRYAKKGALITDVGSTKKHIVEKLEKGLPEKVDFVGSHPMAGSEKGGPLNSQENLFKNRDCFLVRTKKTNNKALLKIKKFWEKLGSRTIEISAPRHDSITADISQMTHIVASSLVLASKGSVEYAASGFKDTTRIALADTDLWRDICITNSKDISRSISNVITVLKKFQKAISNKNEREIKKLLNKARKIRSSLVT